jgi:hypothetical protein
MSGARIRRRQFLRRAGEIALAGMVGGMAAGCSEGQVYIRRDPIVSSPDLSYSPKVSSREKHLYLVGFDGWGDLWLNDDLHTLLKTIFENRKDVRGILVDSVHYWERNVKKVKELIEEYKDREEELRLGSLAFSAGGDQAHKAIRALRDFDFDFATFYDYTRTNDQIVFLPPNVKIGVYYSSSDANDIMAWARGIVDNFKAENGALTRIVIKRKPGTHLNFVNWPNMRDDLEVLISAVHNGKLDEAYERIKAKY